MVWHSEDPKLIHRSNSLFGFFIFPSLLIIFQMSTCEDCIKGFIGSGKPCGEITDVGGIECYVSRPANKSKSAIIISTDIFGHTLVNNQHIADSFANCGFLTVVPDYFSGDVAPEGILNGTATFDFGAWMQKHNPSTKLPIVHKVMNALKEKEGIQKIGAIGFCYGAKIVISLAGDKKIDAAAVAHPSLLEIPGDIEKIQTPSLWLCAEIDQAFPEQSREATKKILKDRGMKADFKFYPGTTHGFAVRGNEKDEKVQAAKTQALKEAVEFFKVELA